MEPTPLQEVVDRYGKDQKFIIHGEWLDSVYLAIKTCYINWSEYFIEPDFRNLDDRDKVYFVAKCHWIINNYNLCEVPKWIISNKYNILSSPYFPSGIKTGMYRLWTMIETPVEFKVRNIFVSENAMIRV